MKALLHVEHWMIQKFKFDRMSNNLFWLAALMLPVIMSMMVWLGGLHEQTGQEFILLRDAAFTERVAEIFYREGAFYVRPLSKQVLLNFQPVSQTTALAENDQLVIGHTMLQVRQLDGWIPHLRTIGYYAKDRELQAGVTVGRSIHPEELNTWATNDLIIRDSTVEPVHLRIFPAPNGQYRLQSVGVKGVLLQTPPDPQTGATAWTPGAHDVVLAAGAQFKIGGSAFELVPVPEQEALALRIARGVQPTYKLSRQARNLIGGIRMTPKDYIPDYLVDEQFLEYVRQAIEHDIFYLDDPTARQKNPPQIYVRGFDATGQLVLPEFQKLSPKQVFLLNKIFRFRTTAGAILRWRRPFNQEAEDSYTFAPTDTSNFIIDAATNQVKNIYEYAARLTNPHTIAAEMATTRGEIYDRDRYSHPRLFAFWQGQSAPSAEFLIVPGNDPNAQISVNPNNEPDISVYVASGYRFPDGATVSSAGADIVLRLKNGQTQRLKDGQEFTAGKMTFRFASAGHGLLAQNLKNGANTQRHYPLGSRLAHLIGYSFAKSQLKGNLEKVFDAVLLGQEQEQPWWTFKRSVARQPGNNLSLTLDDDFERVVSAELQKKLNELNTRYQTNTFRGAAIAINKTGAILASATIPSYNPNDLRSILQALTDATEDPWNSAYINRATQKSYPPGSTMKVIMSTIALDQKDRFLRPLGNGDYAIQNGSGSFVCTGWLDSFQGVSFGKYGIPDFGGAAHGLMTLDSALTQSCNNTFAFLALSAGWETIQEYAERYGFNREFDFLPYSMFRGDLPLVSNIRRDVNDPLLSLRSQVPTPHTPLKLPQLARMGIGQWEILATPLQMATVAMTVGNLGARPFPHLVQGLEDLATRQARTFPYPPTEQVFAPAVMQELHPMMQHVVQHGSAIRITRSTARYYDLKAHVAGKTGTAEVEDQSGRKFNVVWFISFAPVENPQMAVAVVIEKGPIISGEAVEVARGIWEKAVLLFPDLFPAPLSQD